MELALTFLFTILEVIWLFKTSLLHSDAFFSAMSSRKAKLILSGKRVLPQARRKEWTLGSGWTPSTQRF